MNYFLSEVTKNLKCGQEWNKLKHLRFFVSSDETTVKHNWAAGRENNLNRWSAVAAEFKTSASYFH